MARRIKDNMKFILVLLLLVCFLIVVIIFAVFYNINEGCSLDVKKSFSVKHPLLLELTSNNFILPLDGVIKFSKGQEVRLACPGFNNSIYKLNTQEISITCVHNALFTINDNYTGNKYFKLLECLNYPDSTARKTGNNCSSNYTEIEVGFNTNTGFVPMMMSCFDETKQDSLYTMFNLSSQIKYKQSVSRPRDFRRNFYNINPSILYKKRNQINRFEYLLHSKQQAQKFISEKTEFFLARGHLTAKADFIYGFQQRATFYYFNAAPQWQIINAKNWFDLESNCRNYASKTKLNLIVYTGIYGIAKLPDLNGYLQELSITADENNNHLLKVPRLFWKLVYNPVSKDATVFITHNNPYPKRDYKICSDRCNEIKWLTWKPKNITAGFSYCCEYQEVKKIIDYLPDIEVYNLLV